MKRNFPLIVFITIILVAIVYHQVAKPQTATETQIAQNL